MHCIIYVLSFFQNHRFAISLIHLSLLQCNKTMPCRHTQPQTHTPAHMLGDVKTQFLSFLGGTYSSPNCIYFLLVVTSPIGCSHFPVVFFFSNSRRLYALRITMLWNKKHCRSASKQKSAYRRGTPFMLHWIYAAGETHKRNLTLHQHHRTYARVSLSLTRSFCCLRMIMIVPDRLPHGMPPRTHTCKSSTKEATPFWLPRVIRFSRMLFSLFSQ